MTSDKSADTAAEPQLGASVRITDPIQIRLHNDITEALLAYIADCNGAGRAFEPAAIIVCQLLGYQIALAISEMENPTLRELMMGSVEQGLRASVASLRAEFGLGGSAPQ